jgi:hypothetical protein
MSLISGCLCVPVITLSRPREAKSQAPPPLVPRNRCIETITKKEDSMKSENSELRNPQPGIPAKKISSSPAARSRRKFLEYLGGTTGVALASGASPLIRTATPDTRPASTSRPTRAEQAYQIRVSSALREKKAPPAAHPVNGDEERYSDKIASYSKGLPHFKKVESEKC